MSDIKADEAVLQVRLPNDQLELLENQRNFNTLLLKMHAAHVIEARWLWRITIFNLICCIILLFSSFASGAEFTKYEVKYAIPNNLLKTICAVESGLVKGTLNVNDFGSPSYGRCQIKEIAARQVGWVGFDIYELLYGEAEIQYAARYLRYQYVRYGDWVLAVAAYNAGRVKLNSEGQFINHNYVRRVLNKCQMLGCQMKLLSLGPVIYPPKKL